MTFKEALNIGRQSPADGEPFRVLVAVGYSPLHVEAFLKAYLTLALPDRSVQTRSGLYGDLPHSLMQAAEEGPNPPHAIALSIEWPDLDPRLGYRRLGRWSQKELADVVASAEAKLKWIADALASIPDSISVAIAGPTLPPAPATGVPTWLADGAELEIRSRLDAFLTDAAHAGRKVINPYFLERVSPPENRLDARGLLATDSPYTRDHADRLAEVFAQALLPDRPKKGLITDLDDTLWKGIVGEIGADAVGWDLDSGAQIHGLYQQLLASLAEHGTLLAIASKNDRQNVDAAFERSDIRIPMDSFFPTEVHWNPKSGSVSRILKAWNIGADAVVFLDDSPAELGEVQAAHPEVECILFPKNDPAEALRLLGRLRDVFGKTRVSAEDALRLQSLRSAAELQEASQDQDALERFLSTADGKLSFDLVSGDARTLELINKTNQFNLNGIRYSVADWAASRARPGAFTISVSYEDKFGPLGKIAVIHGVSDAGEAAVDVWVMSCRAFSRRIEYHTVEAIFSKLAAESVTFRLRETPKNAPVRKLLADWTGNGASPPVTLGRSRFLELLPTLYHQVQYAEES